MTALRETSLNGHQRVVELLLGAGANPDLQDQVRTVQDPELLPYCWYQFFPPVCYENINLYLNCDEYGTSTVCAKG